MNKTRPIMDELTRRYVTLIGEKEAEKLLEVNYVKQAILVNTLIVEQENLIKKLSSERVKLTPIDFAHNAFVIDNTKNAPGSFPEYLLGQYYLLDKGSIFVAEALNAKPGDSVLDMCASPGGKLIHTAIRMKNKGTIVALDLKKRADALKNNLERMKIQNVLTYSLDALDASSLGIKFDKILLDAPCSGNFVADSNWFIKRSASQFQDRSELQKKLLKQGLSLLKQGGYLVYSTCSLEPEENEEVIDYAIKHLSVKVEKIDINFGSPGLSNAFGNTYDPQINNCVRLWPHKTHTQPFFVAKLTKN